MDTLKSAKRLRDAGMEENVANEIVEVIKETQEQSINDLATKHDIVLLEAKLESVKKDIIIKLGTLITIAVGIVAALIKF